MPGTLRGRCGHRPAPLKALTDGGGERDTADPRPPNAPDQIGDPCDGLLRGPNRRRPARHPGGAGQREGRRAGAGADSTAIAEMLYERGIGVVSSDVFMIGKTKPGNGIRIHKGSARSDTEWDIALSLIATLVRKPE
ncbi:hypothetical protein [Azospirillum baldaniorum]|uniref:hypothetical protein n=1 Tax=Azospirillum baldaniorum TaxID=1064539 RepID=UPI00157AD95F|nr:hypothetical protein [Azospirillum baldaniorum]